MTEQSQDEEQPREDVEGFCPRVGEQVLILSNHCFRSERVWACQGCIFNVDFPIVKLTILLKEMVESRGVRDG